MTRHVGFSARTFGVGALSLILLGGGLAREALAQVAGGAISGRVTDPSGGVIPQASVTITNVATSVLTTTTGTATPLAFSPELPLAGLY